MKPSEFRALKYSFWRNVRSSESLATTFYTESKNKKDTEDFNFSLFFKSHYADEISILQWTSCRINIIICHTSNMHDHGFIKVKHCIIYSSYFLIFHHVVTQKLFLFLNWSPWALLELALYARQTIIIEPCRRDSPLMRKGSAHV